MSDTQGWVKIYRSILDDDLWDIDMPYDYRSAWIELILKANHKHATAYGEPISRGQHKTSLRKLCERWHWRHSKLKSFLQSLVADGKITVDYRKTSVLITIVNYDKYQVFTKGSTEGSTKGSSGVSSGVSTAGTQTRMIKNDIKNDKERETVAFDNDEGGERE